RRRKRFLWRISALALVVAVAAAYGIQWKLKKDHEAEVAALFGTPGGPGGQPVEVARPSPPKEIAGTPEYTPPAPEGAAFLTVLADVPAWVLIDGSRLPKTTPVFKVPVPPGNHGVMVMDVTGATREEDRTFEVGKTERLDVKLSPKKAAP
ncbi:MAG TPA: hypothetical protein VND93_15260, partial [Myxococcales bacterium]|nr:hypothetical protein [Myxococcales bacterium]